MARTRNSADWISTRGMAAALGCSIDFLYRLRNSGQLKEGQHWYCLNKTAARPTYRWHERRVRQDMRAN